MKASCIGVLCGTKKTARNIALMCSLVGTCNWTNRLGSLALISESIKSTNSSVAVSNFTANFIPGARHIGQVFFPCSPVQRLIQRPWNV